MYTFKSRLAEIKKVLSSKLRILMRNRYPACWLPAAIGWRCKGLASVKKLPRDLHCNTLQLHWESWFFSSFFVVVSGIFVETHEWEKMMGLESKDCPSFMHQLSRLEPLHLWQRIETIFHPSQNPMDYNRDLFGANQPLKINGCRGAKSKTDR